MAQELQLTLLGNPEVRRDGALVTDLSSKKALALLCYLAVTGRPHLRLNLVGLLWGEMPEALARNNLSKALTHLRRAVGPYLRIARQQVAFDRKSVYWLDVEQFERAVQAPPVSAQPGIRRLAKATELYRGDFLEGFYVRQAPDFEEWVLVQRARLRELALQALHALVAYYEGLGDSGYALAIDYATRLLSLEPWLEEAHRQLMLLLARSGQRGAALAQYWTCCQVLAKELGVEPAEETVALYQQIQAGKLELAVPIRGPPPTSRLPAFLEGEAEMARPAGPVFVERKQEIERLNGYLASALSGQGQVAFVTGEAGTGKTVLVLEFTRRAQAGHNALVVAGGNCNAYTGVGDPYLPFREILELLTGDVESNWYAGAIGTLQARRLWDLLPHSAQALVETSPDLIGTLVDGPSLVARTATAVPGGARWLDQLKALAAREEPGRGQANLRQTDLFEQYASLLAFLARKHPLLLVLDDLQWADAGSVSLLFHLGRQLAGSRILIVGLYRPADVAMGRNGERHPLEPVVCEFQRFYGQIKVNLGQNTDRPFVESFLDTEPNRLDAGFRDALYRQTRGHPLFTVEMLLGMQERGDLVKDASGRWVEGTNVDWELLPARVEGVIGERFGRLPVKLQEMLKVASVEGEVFTAEVVAQVGGSGELETVGQLSGDLDRRHRLVREEGSRQVAPGGQRISRYRFRHILFQKYIYGNLDRAERAYLHKAVGNALEQLFRGQSGTVAIQLARHYQLAGLALKATGYFLQAGERALRSYAFKEAIALLTQGLALLKTLPDSPERAQRELALQLARANAAMIAKGFAAPEVGHAYARAWVLCQEIGAQREPELFPALFGLWGYWFTKAEHHRAREMGEQLEDLAQHAQDRALLLQAHHALWTSLFSVGEFAYAREHVEQGIALYDPQEHRSLAVRYGGHDAKVCGLSWAGPALWYLGYPEQALQTSLAALTLAQELEHPVSLAQALKWSAALHQFRREVEGVQERAAAAMALATEREYPLWVGWAGALQGWALAQQGQVEAGIAQICRGLDAYQATGAAMDQPYMLALLVEVYLITGQVQEGLSTVDEALSVACSTGERYYEAELHRLRGELLLAQREGGGAAEAESCFCQAIEVSRQQSARSLELRAAMSLSRLWQAQDKHAEAGLMLAQIYDWFTEGFDTVDLQEARALLAELSR